MKYLLFCRVVGDWLAIRPSVRYGRYRRRASGKLLACRTAAIIKRSSRSSHHHIRLQGRNDARRASWRDAPGQPCQVCYRAAVGHRRRCRVLLPAAQGRQGRVHYDDLRVGTSRSSARFMNVPSTRTDGRSLPPGRLMSACWMLTTPRGDLLVPHRNPPGPSRPRHRYPDHQRASGGGRAQRPGPGSRRAHGHRRAHALYRRLGLTEVARHGDPGTKVTMRSAHHRK